MQPSTLLLVATAAALLLVSGYGVQRLATEGAEAPEDADWTDYFDLAMFSVREAALQPPAAQLAPSPMLLAMLQEGEGLRLTRYRLGDGGWTIGYGRYFPDGGPEPPATISRETAEAWFAEDVEAKAARWVRAYVTAPLRQHEFDALTHMAYNLKPSSFKTIADAVNGGVDPEAAAMRYVRAGTGLEEGLRRRRRRELALFRQGIYA